MNKIDTLAEVERVQIPPSAPEAEQKPAENTGERNACVHECGQPRGFRSERRAIREARQRCHNPSNKDYADYGGRGIVVCDEWHGADGIALFIRHIGPKPTPAHTLDRIDPSGNYEPGNVRWATMIEQGNNRRSSLLVTWRGETLTAAQWAKRIGIRRQYVANRIAKGWDIERALTTPCKPNASNDNSVTRDEAANG